MSNLLTTNPNGNLKIKISGDFGNGMKVTGAYLAPVTSKGTRWVNVFYNRYKGNSAEIMPDGTLRLECGDEDVKTYQAVFNAAVEQYGG
jgi:hypothetical protein